MWAGRAATTKYPNHLGDYNIFAGIYNGDVHVGAVQFDLSSVSPGTPIVYADITITGLSDEFVGGDAAWGVDLLQPWLSSGWQERNFHWFERADSVAASLTPLQQPLELSVGAGNTFVFTPEGLGLLQARLFEGQAAVRVTGPQEGADNLYGWDSGFGARSFGRAPLLRLVTGPPPDVPPPTPTPDLVIITPVPQDAQLLAMAEERLTATAQATPYVGDETPTATSTATEQPPNWVTPMIIVNTPQPEDQATAQWQAQIATAQAIVHGTATPLPPNAWTATPTPLPPGPTPTPQLVAYDLLTATPTTTATPGALPEILRGKILFFSDRSGGSKLMVMDPDGSNVAVWAAGSDAWVYEQAKLEEDVSPNGRFRAVVSSEQINNLQVWSLDLNTGDRLRLTYFEDVAYDPAWSPAGNTIAFVSPDPGNDEIYLIEADGSNLRRLTTNEWEWDKHPSWSPDGSQIVFWSNRETQRKQIWRMNADGSGLRNLSNNEYNDWDPVWVK